MTPWLTHSGHSIQRRRDLLSSIAFAQFQSTFEQRSRTFHVDDARQSDSVRSPSTFKSAQHAFSASDCARTEHSGTVPLTSVIQKESRLRRAGRLVRVSEVVSAANEAGVRRARVLRAE